MTDHETEPLAADLAELLGAEAARPPLRAAVEARLLARVTASIGSIPGSGGSNGGQSAAPPAAATTASGGARLALTALATFVLGAAVGAGIHRELAPRSSELVPVAFPVIVRVAEPSPPASTSVAAIVTPAPSASASAAPSAHHLENADASSRDAELAAERALLEVARTAASRGQNGAALAALEKHAEEFPRGRLSEEREALWIQALIASGKLDEARVRAARFKKSFPRSMALTAIEAALGTIP